jgi:hypothetical protein
MHSVFKTVVGSPLYRGIEGRRGVGDPENTQIQIHPNGGRHVVAYCKISTSTQGRIKVVNPKSYKPTPDEKVKIVPFKAGSR